MDFLSRLTGRIDNMITFTMVNFLHRTSRYYTSSTELILIGICLSVIFWPRGEIRGLGFQLTSVCQQVSMLILSQEIISQIEPHNQIDLWNGSTFVLTVVAIISFLSALPPSISQKQNFQQFIDLVLFMFAESSRYVLFDTKISSIFGPLSVIMLYSLKQFHTESVVFTTLINGANLFFTNTVISAIFDMSADNYDILLWLTGITVFVSYFQEIVPDFQSVSDFTIWKSARLISNFIIDQGVDFYVLLSSSTACLVMGIPGLDSLSILLVINSLLQSVTESLRMISANDIIFVLFLVTILIKILIWNLRKFN